LESYLFIYYSDH